MPIQDVRFNPEVILRRFSKIDIIFSENALFFFNRSKIALKKNQKGCYLSDLVHHAGHKLTEICLKKNNYAGSNMPQNFFFIIFRLNFSHDYQTI